MNEGIKKTSIYTNPIFTTLRICLANGIFKMYYGSLQVVVYIFSFLDHKDKSIELYKPTSTHHFHQDLQYCRHN